MLVFFFSVLCAMQLDGDEHRILLSKRCPSSSLSLRYLSVFSFFVRSSSLLLDDPLLLLLLLLFR